MALKDKTLKDKFEMKTMTERILSIKRLKMLTDELKKNPKMLILIFSGIVAFLIFRFKK